MKLSEFNYNLPRDLIAQNPLMERDRCRLMVLDRHDRTLRDGIFSDFVNYLNAGDLVVLNDTKVIPARLLGNRKTGARVEIFLLEKREGMCEALVYPSGRIDVGEKIILESGHEAEILGTGEIGRFVRFSRSIDEILARAGHVPLPPYIDRTDEERDRADYQTVFGRIEGATASPTAGLHFTKELLKKIEDKGARIAYVTLHTNYGTFATIREEDVEDHRMHREHFELPRQTIEAVVETKRTGRKVFAVGTTASRVLEHCAYEIGSGTLPGKGISGFTKIFIYPGYQFKIVDHLITNFHLPKSTLLLMVSAFADKDFILEAYQQAIQKSYRFLSYGDAMLIL